VLQQPVFPDFTQFRRFDSTVQESVDNTGQAISGQKTWTTVLVPLRSGRFTLGPVHLSYFDPASRSYKTLQSEPFQIQARHIPRTAAVPEVIGGASNPSSQTSRPNIFVWLIDHYEKWVYHLGGGLFALLFLFWVWVKYRQRLSADVRLIRLMRAKHVARKHLKKARSLMKESHKEAYYSAVAKALSGYVGDKFNLEVTGMTQDQVLDTLEAHQVDEAVRYEIRELFDACDFGRFAPSKVALNEMKQVYEKVQSLMIKL
jgi:hypothetical protein